MQYLAIYHTLFITLKRGNKENQCDHQIEIKVNVTVTVLVTFWSHKNTTYHSLYVTKIYDVYGDTMKANPLILIHACITCNLNTI